MVFTKCKTSEYLRQSRRAARWVTWAAKVTEVGVENLSISSNCVHASCAPVHQLLNAPKIYFSHDRTNTT